MIDGKIYIFGEYHSPRRLTNVMEYDPGSDSWRSLGEFSEIFYSHGSCVYDGLIYQFGGYDKDFNHQKWVRTYDPATDSWSQLPDMLMADAKSAVCVYNDEIYLFNEKAQKFSPSDSSWTLLNTGTNDIVGYALPIVNGDSILLFGGYKWTDDYPAPDTSIYAYYPDLDTMKKLDVGMPFKRFTGGHKYQNFAYLFGGHNDASLGSVTDEVWRFNLDFIVSVEGNSSIDADRLSIFPNPAHDLLSIQTDLNGTHIIIIFSMNGQEIYSGEMEGSSHQIDISSFKTGVYIITIRSEDFFICRKIIKL